MTGLTAADVDVLPPVQWRRFADLLRRWAAVAERGSRARCQRAACCRRCAIPAATNKGNRRERSCDTDFSLGRPLYRSRPVRQPLPALGLRLVPYVHDRLAAAGIILALGRRTVA